MLSRGLLAFSLLGSEWVLYLLLAISIGSIALIIERWFFFRDASRGAVDFREKVRSQIETGHLDEALALAKTQHASSREHPSLDAAVANTLLSLKGKPASALEHASHDSIAVAKLRWEKNLAILATIGANAPFVGLFGTVLGIIQAFHDLSGQAATGVQGVTSGLAEALVATAVGILVAIPAVVAFNLFQRKVRSAVSQAEALQNFILSRLERPGTH